MNKEVLGIRIPASNAHSASLESFKSLRTNLIYSEGVKVITVTSTLPNEGKTMLSYNLAQSFAQMDKSVLLIDADLRKGSLKRWFTASRTLPGLSEALTGQSGEIINSTKVPNLEVILSGKLPPNSTELLSSEMFEAIIDKLRRSYDYIIIDTPPMTAAMDGAIVGRVSDGVVLVVRNDFVKKKEVLRVQKQLERNGARVVGVVLNRVQKDQVDYKSYDYDYYKTNKE